MRRGLGLVFIGLSATAAACGSRGTPDLPAPEDAAVEGGSPPGTDAGGIDAAPDAPSRGFCVSLSPAPKFCDDFDDGLLSNGWDQLTIVPGSDGAIDGTSVRSKPGAFLVETRAAGDNDVAHVHLRKSVVGRPARAMLTFSVRMADTAPAIGAVAIATLDMATNHLFTLYLRDDDAVRPGPALVEIAGGARSRLALPRVPAADTWTRVTLDVDLLGGRARVTYDGALVAEGAIASVPGAVDPTARVGVYAFGPLPAQTARFDDVVLDF